MYDDPALYVFQIEVWDWDRMGGHDFLGHAFLALLPNAGHGAMTLKLRTFDDLTLWTIGEAEPEPDIRRPVVISASGRAEKAESKRALPAKKKVLPKKAEPPRPKRADPPPKKAPPPRPGGNVSGKKPVVVQNNVPPPKPGPPGRPGTAPSRPGPPAAARPVTPSALPTKTAPPVAAAPPPEPEPEPVKPVTAAAEVPVHDDADVLDGADAAYSLDEAACQAGPAAAADTPADTTLSGTDDVAAGVATDAGATPTAAEPATEEPEPVESSEPAPVAETESAAAAAEGATDAFAVADPAEAAAVVPEPREAADVAAEPPVPATDFVPPPKPAPPSKPGPPRPAGIAKTPGVVQNNIPPPKLGPPGRPGAAPSRSNRMQNTIPRAKPGPPVGTLANPIADLIKLQAPDGSFELTGPLCAVIGADLDVSQRAAIETAQGKDDILGTVQTLVATSLTLAFLQKELADKRVQWAPMAANAEKWMQTHTKAAMTADDLSMVMNKPGPSARAPTRPNPVKPGPPRPVNSTKTAPSKPGPRRPTVSSKKPAASRNRNPPDKPGPPRPAATASGNPDKPAPPGRDASISGKKPVVVQNNVPPPKPGPPGRPGTAPSRPGPPAAARPVTPSALPTKTAPPVAAAPPPEPEPEPVKPVTAAAEVPVHDDADVLDGADAAYSLDEAACQAGPAAAADTPADTTLSGTDDVAAGVATDAGATPTAAEPATEEPEPVESSEPAPVAATLSAAAAAAEGATDASAIAELTEAAEAPVPVADQATHVAPMSPDEVERTKQEDEFEALVQTEGLAAALGFDNAAASYDETAVAGAAPVADEMKVQDPTLAAAQPTVVDVPEAAKEGDSADLAQVGDTRAEDGSPAAEGCPAKTATPFAGASPSDDPIPVAEEPQTKEKPPANPKQPPTKPGPPVRPAAAALKSTPGAGPPRPGAPARSASRSKPNRPGVVAQTAASAKPGPPAKPGRPTRADPPGRPGKSGPPGKPARPVAQHSKQPPPKPGPPAKPGKSAGGGGISAGGIAGGVVGSSIASAAGGGLIGGIAGGLLGSRAGSRVGKQSNKPKPAPGKAAKPGKPGPPKPSNPTKAVAPTKPAKPGPPAKPAKPGPKGSAKPKPGPPAKPGPPKPGPPKPAAPVSKPSASSSVGRAVATADFEAMEAGDLGFKNGDIINVTDELDAEWLKGEINGQTGIFPKSFVRMDGVASQKFLPAADAAPAVEAPVSVAEPVGKAICTADFDAVQDDDLGMKKGDEVVVLEIIDADWLRGSLNGAEGTFPASFVDMLAAPAGGAVTSVESAAAEPAPAETAVADVDVIQAASGEGVSAAEPESALAVSPAGKPGRAVCTADFAADQDGDLGMKEGDDVVVLEIIDADWLRGSLHGAEGMFPASFVDMVEAPSAGDAPTPTATESVSPVSNSAPEAVPASVAEPEPTAGSAPTALAPGGGSGKAICTADFAADQDGDLKMKEGDEVVVLEIIDADWLRGSLNGAEGMFPASFVNMIEVPSGSDRTEALTAVEATVETRPAEFLPETAAMSTDVVPESGPATVNELAPTVEAPLPVAASEPVATAPSGGVVKAICNADFDAAQDGDLGMKEGDEVVVLEIIDADWLRGSLNGAEGMFPASFVGMVEAPSEDGVSAAEPKSAPAVIPAGKPGRAVCTADFAADQDGDLEMKEGDEVVVLEIVDADWLRGSLNGAEGMFPASFVNMVEAPSAGDAPVAAAPTPLAGDSYPVGAGKATASSDFVAMDDTELALKTGDQPIILEVIDHDWFRGALNGKEGRFPRSFLDFDSIKLPSADAPPAPPPLATALVGKAIATADFDAEADGDLGLKTGDVIVILEAVDADWFRGSLDGVEGMFPQSFVDVTEPIPSP